MTDTEKVIKSINTNVRPQELLFTKCLLLLKDFLNGKKIKLIKFNLMEIKTYPDVLIGRYYSIQLLYLDQEMKEKQFKEVFEMALNEGRNMPNKASYFYEFIQVLLLKKKFYEMNRLIQDFYDDLFESDIVFVRVHDFLYILSDAIVSWSSNELKASRESFKMLDLSYLSFSFSNQYFQLFYHILGYHQIEDEAKKQNHFEEYTNIAKISKFKFFNSAYLKTYFDSCDENWK